MRARLLNAVLLGILAIFAAPGSAQDRMPIFDAHMHYNWEPTPFYSMEQILEVFRRNNVTGVLATSRPNDGTRALVAAKPAGLWVVPFIRPYRTRADLTTWFKDPAIYELIETEFKRGYYRGIGEFHLYESGNARGEIAAKAVRFAAERGLYIHAHCDADAVEILFSHDPRAKIIWAHTGFSTSPARVRQMLEKYPALWGELSYRGGITDGPGKVSAEWRDLFARHSDRFLLGSDTWINERWFSYDNIMNGYREWLVLLPRDQALNIAHRNAERLFGPRPAD